MRFHYFFYPSAMLYEPVPIQIRCRYEYLGGGGGIGSIRLDSRNNLLLIELSGFAAYE